MADIPTFGYDWRVHVDWSDTGMYDHARSNVSDLWLRASYEEGTARRSNPQRPTPVHGRGSITFIGDDFVPGRSKVLTATQIRTRHRIRFRLGTTLLFSGWVQEGRHQEGLSDGGIFTEFQLEGYLERPGRATKTISQSATDADTTTASVLSLLKDAYGIADADFMHNLSDTPLTVYSFNGPAAQYGSQFGQVAGGLPTARKGGKLALLDPTRLPSPIPRVYDQSEYTILGATTEFDLEQLWNQAIVSYTEGGGVTTLYQTGTAEWRQDSIGEWTTTVDLGDPPANSTYSDATISPSGIATALYTPGGNVVRDFHPSTIEPLFIPELGVSLAGNILTITATQEGLTAASPGTWNGAGGPSSRWFSGGRGISVVRQPWAVEYTVTTSDVQRDIEVVNQESIEEWDSRTLTFPAWFAPSAVDTIQERLDGLAEPRDIHTVDFAIEQPTSQRTTNVINLEAGDFMSLVVDDPRTRTEINALVWIMNVRWELHRNRVPYKRLTLIETGAQGVRDSLEIRVSLSEPAGIVTPVRPSQVRSLTVGSIAATTATATWSPPVSGTPPLTYEYRIAQGSSTPRGSWTSVGADTHIDLTGLIANTQYTIQVRARNAINVSGNRTARFTTVVAAMRVGTGEPINLDISLSEPTGANTNRVGTGEPLDIELTLSEAVGADTDRSGSGEALDLELSLSEPSGANTARSGVGESLDIDISLSEPAGDAGVVNTGVGEPITLDLSLSEPAGANTSRSGVGESLDIELTLSESVGSVTRIGVGETITFELSLSEPTGLADRVGTGEPLALSLSLSEPAGSNTSRSGTGESLDIELTLSEPEGEVTLVPLGALTTDDIPIKLDNKFIVIEFPSHEGIGEPITLDLSLSEPAGSIGGNVGVGESLALQMSLSEPAGRGGHSGSGEALDLNITLAETSGDNTNRTGVGEALAIEVMLSEAAGSSAGDTPTGALTVDRTPIKLDDRFLVVGQEG